MPQAPNPVQGKMPEGYTSVEVYREVYQRIYGAWDPEEMDWVVNFKLAEVANIGCASRLPILYRSHCSNGSDLTEERVA